MFLLQPSVMILTLSFCKLLVFILSNVCRTSALPPARPRSQPSPCGSVVAERTVVRKGAKVRNVPRILSGTIFIYLPPKCRKNYEKSLVFSTGSSLFLYRTILCPGRKPKLHQCRRH